MSLTISILSRLFPAAPTDFVGIAEKKDWPCRAEILGEVLLSPIPGTSDFYTRSLLLPLRKVLPKGVFVVSSWRIPRETLVAFVARFYYTDGTHKDVIVPKKMRTDCGSIPRWLRSVEELAPTRWAGAYVPHNKIFGDRCYSDGTPIKLDEADWLLLLLLFYLKAPKRERTVIYRGLRCGSWFVWYISGDSAPFRKRFRKRKQRH